MSDNLFDNYVAKGKNQCSQVWKYFLKGVGPAANTAKCKTCSAVLKVSGGSTKGLHNHVKTHDIVLKEQGNKFGESSGKGILSVLNDESESSEETGMFRKKRKIADFLVTGEEGSLEATLSRMVAQDGLSFRIFCVSRDLRAALGSMGFTDLPSSSNAIRKIVQRYSKRLRRSVTSEIINMISEGERLSLTLNEWTSTRNKKYLNVKVHSCYKLWNLGLIRIPSSMLAEEGVQLVDSKLAEVGLSFAENIISVTTDATPFMVRIGEFMNIEKQYCFARCIQLAVLDVLYKPQTDIRRSKRDEEQDYDTSDGGEFEDSDCEEEEADDSGFSVEYVDKAPGLQVELQQHIMILVEKVRKAVKLFKRSPTFAVLQKYVSTENGKSLHLILDCKTRWSSLLTMLERFLRLKDSIALSLIDVKSSIRFPSEDFQLIADIVAVLEPVRVVVEALTAPSANLLTADTMFKFMLEQLNKQPSALARKMEHALIKRIGEQRTNLSSVLQYLHNPGNKEDGYFSLFAIPSKAIICDVVNSLVERLAYRGNMEASSPDIDCFKQTTPSLANEDAQLSMKEQLNLAIKKTLTEASFQSQMVQVETSSHKGLMMVIQREMNLFEGGSSRGYHLQLVYKYLTSIPPTSCEAERAFANTAHTCTRIHSRLRDSALDDLIFLRSFLSSRVEEGENNTEL